MKRFITIERYDGTVTAHQQGEDYAAILADEDVACWVWQYADNAEAAIAAHPEKHAAWEADMEAGRPEQETY